MDETRFISSYRQITECSESLARSVYILMAERMLRRPFHPVRPE